MSLFFLKALQGEKPYCDWYGLPEKKTYKFHPERRPKDCPHDCQYCPKPFFGECGFFGTDDEDEQGDNKE